MYMHITIIIREEVLSVKMEKKGIRMSLKAENGRGNSEIVV